MSPNPNVGSPDWQRGTVNAGKLLASVPSTDGTVTVSIPPNAETLIVITPTENVSYSIVCEGVTTGMYYPGSFRQSPLFAEGHTMVMFSIAPEVDDQVNIIWGTNPGVEWYVYSDNGQQVMTTPDVVAVTQQSGGNVGSLGVLVMGNGGSSAVPLALDANGRQIPLVPYQFESQSVPAGTTQILAALSTGARYLFGFDVTSPASAVTTVALEIASTFIAAYCNPPASGESKTIDLQGFRAAGAISVYATAAATVALRYAIVP